MTILQRNHNRGKEVFDHTVMAMKTELHTSHQKASSSPCSGGILDPQSLKYTVGAENRGYCLLGR